MIESVGIGRSDQDECCHHAWPGLRCVILDLSVGALCILLAIGNQHYLAPS